MNYVGIDFSINSPGVCVLKDGKPHWISYLNSTKSTKKDRAAQQEMAKLSDVSLVFQDEPDISKHELTRVNRHINIAENLMAMIIEHTDPSKPYRIYFEGASYGTSRFGTNSLLDLQAAASILKCKLIETLNVEDLDVIAPTAIKKFAGKGNMNKEAMWKAFVDSDSFQSSEFHSFCQPFRDEKKLVKPLDDLVDAAFLLMYLLSLQPSTQD